MLEYHSRHSPGFEGTSGTQSGVQFIRTEATDSPEARLWFHNRSYQKEIYIVEELQLIAYVAISDAD